MTNAASSVGGGGGRAIIARLNEVAKERGQAIARQWGEPLGSDKLSRDQMVTLWHLTGPAMQTPDGQTQIAQLVSQGQHAQALALAYPYRDQLIGKGSPSRRIERAKQLAALANPDAPTDQPGSPLAEPPTENVPPEAVQP